MSSQQVENLISIFTPKDENIVPNQNTTEPPSCCKSTALTPEKYSLLSYSAEVPLWIGFKMLSWWSICNLEYDALRPISKSPQKSVQLENKNINFIWTQNKENNIAGLR